MGRVGAVACVATAAVTAAAATMVMAARTVGRGRCNQQQSKENLALKI